MKIACVLTLSVFFLAGVAVASDSGHSNAPGPEVSYLYQQEEAKTLVRKAVEFYKKNGLDATIAAVNDPKGQFRDGELYIFIHSFDGINIARGDGDKKRLGSVVINDRDADGKLFVREMIKNAREYGFGRESYKFKNPLTGKIQTKHSYFEKIDGAIIGCGYFN